MHSAHSCYSDAGIYCIAANLTPEFQKLELGQCRVRNMACVCVCVCVCVLWYLGYA
jgi:hypothetical protein